MRRLGLLATSSTLMVAMVAGGAVTGATSARAVAELCSASPVVTSTNASGAGSLAGEISAACPGATVSFTPGLSGTITPSETLYISNNLTIAGPGAGQLAVSGSNEHSVFGIGETVTVTISGLSITNGRSAWGGGIYVYEGDQVTLSQDSFSNNTASPIFEGTANGGAIWNEGSLTVSGDTFFGNVAQNFGVAKGGAIWNNGTMAVADSTFVNNQSNGFFDAYGGAIWSGSPHTFLTNDTIANNSASAFDGGVGGGGIYGPANVANTILSSNVDSVFTLSPSGANCSNAVTDGGNNLEFGDNTCGLTNGVNGDIVGSDPQLSALAYNGGPTQTMAPAASSPAIAAGNNTYCAAPVSIWSFGAGGVDQAGVRRPQGATCDIGAVELTGVGGTGVQYAFTLTSSANPAPVGAPVTYTVSVSPAPSGWVSFLDGNQIIPGCGGELLVMGSHASCTVPGYSSAGTHLITAQIYVIAPYINSHPLTETVSGG